MNTQNQSLLNAYSKQARAPHLPGTPRTFKRMKQALIGIPTSVSWAVSEYCEDMAPVAVIRVRASVYRLQSAFDGSIPQKRKIRRAIKATISVFAILVLTVVPTSAIHQMGIHAIDNASDTQGKNEVFVAALTHANLPMSLQAHTIATTTTETESPETADFRLALESLMLINEQSGNEASLSAENEAASVESPHEHPAFQDYQTNESDDLPDSGAIIEDSNPPVSDSDTTLAPRNIEATAAQGPVVHNLMTIPEYITQMTEVTIGDTASTGSYIWPTYGTLSSRFGYRDTTIGSNNHQGIDISGPAGRPIRAADGGEVIRSGWSRSFGNVVQIRHDNGHITIYAHCSSLLVSVGDRVSQGQEIARKGRTGTASGVHLHFELIIDGVHVDPLLYLPQV